MLYYFWMVTEGGFARAADRLEMAVQTISAQVQDLEKSWVTNCQAIGPRCGAHRGGPGGIWTGRRNIPAGSVHCR